jgi:hypothetical protein
MGKRVAPGSPQGDLDVGGSGEIGSSPAMPDPHGACDMRHPETSYTSLSFIYIHRQLRTSNLDRPGPEASKPALGHAGAAWVEGRFGKRAPATARASGARGQVFLFTMLKSRKLI